MQPPMGRPPEAPRVLGPYRHGKNRWTLEVRLGPRSVEGARETHSFGTEAEANAFKATIERGLPRLTRARSFEDSIRAYQEALRAKGNKEGSVGLTCHRLGIFFKPVLQRDLGSLKPIQAKALYQALITDYAVSTHRNMLLEARSFLKWCVRQKFSSVNALEGVEGQGRRTHGKPDLYTSEARKLYLHCLWRANRGDHGAVAVLMGLVMGMRATEIVTRQARDVDDDGCLLWVPRKDTKTNAGERTLEVPDKLAPLLKALAAGKGPEDYIFPAESETGHHWKEWPREQSHRLCKAAGVPLVCAHGLRNTQSSIGRERGLAAKVVADTLGHESETMQDKSYVRRGAAETGRTRRALRVLEGGR